MRFGLKVVAFAALVVGFAVAGVRAGDDAKKVVHCSSKDGKWEDGPAKGVKMIHCVGDLTKEGHATFTKFEAGTDHGWHTHTSDVSLCVLSGAYLYKGEDGKELRVGAGEMIFVPGGTKHWSGGDAKEGALFYQHSPGKFDMNHIDAPKK